MPFAARFSLPPAQVNELSITEFMLFADTVDEMVRQAQESERTARRQKRR